MRRSRFAPLRRLLLFSGIGLGLGLALFPAGSLAASLLLASAPTVTLDSEEQRIALHVDAAGQAALRQLAQGQPASLPGDPALYRSALLVLDDVSVTAAGARGGYFYKIRLAPDATAPDLARQTAHLAGTLGPFEIAAARQRQDASLRYGLAEALAGMRVAQTIVVSFRREGGNMPEGGLIRLGQVRLVLSTEPGS